MTDNREWTRGEHLVAVDHSTAPSGGGPASKAWRIKTLAAQLIDAIELYCPPGRWRSMAVTSVEEGSMWAVKSLFNDEPPPAECEDTMPETTNARIAFAVEMDHNPTMSIDETWRALHAALGLAYGGVDLHANLQTALNAAADLCNHYEDK